MQDSQQPYDKEQDLLRHAQIQGVSIFLNYDEEADIARTGSIFDYEPNDKILTIHVYNLAQQNKQLLLDLIIRHFDEGGLIWKDEKNEELESYKEYKEANPDIQTLEFFKDILTRNDYSALRMSLFMRAEKKAGKSITDYKADIRNKFGDRGANIANLCTAGYFEKEFMPLYNQLSKADFNNAYELAVGQKARALFVHAGMGKEELEEEFEKILKKALKYHMQDFRIHGLGGHNVKVIREFLSALPANDRYNVKRIEETETPVKAIEYTVSLIWK